jgi:hypothetical protein
MFKANAQLCADFIYPNWPAPIGVNALCTTRKPGVSQPPFNGFNLATHVGDDINAVLSNRQQLMALAGLPSQPIWLDQQHTTHLICLNDRLNNNRPFKETINLPIADASWTNQPGLVPVVMTADCLPILITNQAGSLVCAIHAGWKGLAAGIVSKSVKALPESPERLMAWIGPAIGPQAFEVGEEVRQVFMDKSANHACFFKPMTQHNKYLADLPGLVTFELNQLGVAMVYGGDLCTYSDLCNDESRFFSYRRSGQTGRIASLIWLEPNGHLY